MSEGDQASQLQLQPDMEHERREWRVQRFGWLLLALFCGAALAGLLGPGPISHRQQGRIGSNLYFEYDRFVRHGASYPLKVYVRPENSHDRFTLAINRSWVERAGIKDIQPQPSETTTAGENYLFHFNHRGEAEQLLTIYFEPKTFGNLAGALALDESPPELFKQFVWP